MGKDTFQPPALMVAKKVGRILVCSRSLTASLDKAVAYATAEMHRRLPGLIPAWEEFNGVSWKGDKWFGTRIDHMSEGEDNTASHMRTQAVAEKLSCDASVWGWRNWKMVVHRNMELNVVQCWNFYILPHKNGAADFSVQKLGIATNLEVRYNRYTYDYRKGKQPYAPAKQYVLKSELGRIEDSEARKVEKSCIAAVSNGKPPARGNEWLKSSPTEAAIRAGAVLQQLGIAFEYNENFDDN